MSPAPPPTPDTATDELHRLAALYATGLLGLDRDEALDALVAAAASLLGTPDAMLTLVDRDMLHVRSAHAEPIAPVPRAMSICNHALGEEDGLVVDDLAADPRFADNPFVTGGLRFYAGVPVHAADDAGAARAIGALCVVGRQPRRLDPREREALRNLARVADVLIAARADAQRAVGIAVEHERLGAELARQHRVFAQAERMTGIGSWRLSLDDDTLEWSEGVYRIYGLPADRPATVQAGLDAYPPEARGRVAAALTRSIDLGEPFDFEEDFHAADGRLCRVRCIGEAERVDGRSVALVGVFQDVTERHRMEAALRRDADTDALTGLANRAAFDRTLSAAMDRTRAARSPLLLALVDLDGFKAVNDTLGHAAGDDVLRQVGAALRALPVDATFAARIGGDEFALLLEGDAADPAAVAAALDRALLFAATGNGLTLACSGSVGMAMLGDEAAAREFVHRADLALYASKRARVGERRRAA